MLPLSAFTALITYLILRVMTAYLIVRICGFPREGEFKLHSKEADAWMGNNLFVGMLNHLMTILGVPQDGVLWVYRKALKAKIGRLRITAGLIHDPCLTEIGDNTIIGNNSLILAHYIKGDKLKIKRTRIGKNCTIGAYAIISPGVTIGDNTIVGAHAFVPKNKKLDSNSVYVGVPARKMKKLKK